MHETIFSIANAAAMPAWLMLAFAREHALTKRLVRSGAYALVFSALYAALLVAMFLTPGAGGDMSTLASIQHAFSTPEVALLGWVHYLAFDLLVGVRVTEEGIESGWSWPPMIPFLFFTLMLGPFGFLLWRIARAIRSKMKG